MNTNTQALRGAQTTTPLCEQAKIDFPKQRFPELLWAGLAHQLEHELTTLRLSQPPAPEQASGDRCPFCGGTKGHWEGCKAPDMPSATPTAEPAVEAVTQIIESAAEQLKTCARTWDAPSKAAAAHCDLLAKELLGLLSASPAAPEGAMATDDDQAMMQLIKERDSAEDMADQLAAQIAAITGEEIGEHSSANDPWRNAMLAADEWIAKDIRRLCRDSEPAPEAAQQQQAQGEPEVLTSDDITLIAGQVTLARKEDGTDPSFVYAFARALEQRVLQSHREAIAESKRKAAYWEEEARRYAGNADHWRDKCAIKESAPQQQAQGEPEVWGVWFDGEPPHPWKEEWFIAETIYGDRVVLRSLEKGHTYDYTTADRTYMVAKNVKRWMQFPDGEYVSYEGECHREAIETERDKTHEAVQHQFVLIHQRDEAREAIALKDAEIEQLKGEMADQGPYINKLRDRVSAQRRLLERSFLSLHNAQVARGSDRTTQIMEDITQHLKGTQ